MDWEQNQSELRAYTRPVEVSYEILRAIGAPLSFTELEPRFTEEEVKFAFMNGPLMRKRLTVGDMLIFTNWDRETLWARINPSERSLVK